MNPPDHSTSPATLVDGGLSTELHRLGFSTDHPLWTARALIDAPDLVVAAHRAFIDAGAKVVLTASYQAGITNFTAHLGSSGSARAYVASSVALARQAVSLAAADTGHHDVRVGASLGAYGALLADGSEYHGRYQATWSEVAHEQRARLEVLVQAGPDVVVCETLPTLAEAAVTLGVLDNLIERDRPVEVWLTFTAVEGGFTAGGDPLTQVAELLVERPWVRAIGVNCTEPRHVDAALAALGSVCDVALVAKPNGVPGAGEIARWIERGARFVGGCCGVGARDLVMLADALRRDAH